MWCPRLPLARGFYFILIQRTWNNERLKEKFRAIHQAGVEMFLKNETFDLGAAQKEKSGYHQTH